MLDAFCGEKSGSCQMYIHQNTDLVQAEEKFKELAEAYSTLSNGDKRKHYDLDASIWMRQWVTNRVCCGPGDLVSDPLGKGFSFCWKKHKDIAVDGRNPQTTTWEV